MAVASAFFAYLDNKRSRVTKRTKETKMERKSKDKKIEEEEEG